jgi:hypothetical protein
LTLQTGLFQIVKNNGSYFLSPYVDDQLDKPYFLMEVVRLKRNFPSLDQGFIELLSERIKEHRFTKKQFHDAINRVIDTCQYPPKISDILSYDKGSRLFTYSEMLEKVNAEGKTTGDFESVANINNKRYYRLK